MKKSTYKAARKVIDKELEKLEAMLSSGRSREEIREKSAYISGLYIMLQMIEANNFNHAEE